MTDGKRLWGSNFSPEEIEAAKREGRLLSMELELSRKCNLRCIYCYASAGEELEDELSLDEIYNVLDQAIHLGAKRIIVLGGGEPMVYPQLMDILRFLKARGVGIDLFTNCTLITRELAEEFMALGVCPVIKMNSRHEATQDYLADRPGTYRRIMEGYNHLRAVGYPHEKYPMGIQTVICRQNLPELPGLWTWIRREGMIPYFEMITLQGRAKEHLDLVITSDELHELFQELSRIDREFYHHIWEPHPPIAGLCCNRHAYTCTVTVKGDIIPCPGVDIPVGNIRQTPLADILKQSPVIQDLRNIRERIKGACRDCDQRDICYGCRGMAYQYTGDYLAADPLCWKNPERIK